MRSRKLIVLGITIAALLTLLAALAWPSRSPVDLRLISMGPSGIFQDDGTEAWLLTVSISNCSSGMFLSPKDLMTAEAKITNLWVVAQTLSCLDDLLQKESKEVIVLAPFRAETVRFGIKYLPEPFKFRFMRTLWKMGVWRHSWSSAAARRVLPVGWIQPATRSDYIGRSPHWRLMTAEVSLSQSQGVAK